MKLSEPNHLDPELDPDLDPEQSPAPGVDGQSAVAVAKIRLAYDGTDFSGWQVQPGGLRTVQGELIAALSQLVELDGIPPGAGRTDAGVHAAGQVCSVPVKSLRLFRRVQKALPRMMPDDIQILGVEQEAIDFHARFSARARRYRYQMTTSRDPFRRHTHLRLRGKMDFDAMQAAAAELVGEYEADSFCLTTSIQEGRTRCRVVESRLEAVGEDEWRLHIESDRFLHSMVRTIVGTLLWIGRGRLPADGIGAIIAARDRAAAGPTAPPQGLVFEAVRYDPPSGAD